MYAKQKSLDFLLSKLFVYSNTPLVRFRSVGFVLPYLCPRLCGLVVRVGTLVDIAVHVGRCSFMNSQTPFAGLHIPINNRSSDAQHIAMSYLSSPGRRFDLAPAGNSGYPLRGIEPNHQFIFSGMPANPYCFPVSEVQHDQMSIPSHGLVQFPNFYYSHFQQIPTSPNQTSVNQPSNTTFSKPVREKKPLDVIDPVTKSAVDLKEASKTPEPRKKEPLLLIQPKADESPPISETKDEEEKPTCTQHNDEEIPSTGTLSQEDAVPKESLTADNFGDEALDDIQSQEHLSQTDTTECDDEKKEEEETTSRIRYSRDSILALRTNAGKHRSDLTINFASINRVPRQSSHTHRRKVIEIPRDVDIKRVEGAFVPSKLRNQDANNPSDNLKDVARELNIILNRVSSSNLTETISDIKKLNISTPEDLSLLAKTIFQKGIRQSKYSNVFASICKQLKELEVQGSERFPVLILQQTQELFKKPLNDLITELNAAIDAKIAAAKDESIKRMLEDDRETNIQKGTDSYFGNVTFIAELYLSGCIPVKTITECLKRLNNSLAPEALASLIILLNLCGSDLEQNSKSVLDQCFKRLEQFKDSKNIEVHQIYKVQELVELRSRDWKPIDITTQSQPQIDTSKRSMDDKQRRNFIQLDTKRKSAQSVNPLTPSSLAVTPQSYDSRKLGPTVANWSQGSGLLRPSEDNHLKNSQQSLHHSRESSPRVPLGPQGAWAQPLSVVQQTKEKDYDCILDETKPSARSITKMILLSENECRDIITDCKPKERSALLHNLFELLMDCSSKERNAVGRFCTDMLRMGILKENDIVASCENYFKFCDSDWISDYPQGWLYVAEILHHLISGESNYMTTLLQSVESIRSDTRAAELVAHCIELSRGSTNVEQLVGKLRACNLMWDKLGIPKNEVWDFVYERSIEFTMCGVYDYESGKLKELSELTTNPLSSDKISAYFNALSQRNLSRRFMQSIMPILLKSSDQSKAKIDSFVMSLGILVDHKADRELHILIGFQDPSSNQALVKSWLTSLVEKKVISADALSQWEKSDVDGSVVNILSSIPELRNL
ncbi:translation initiation factor 4G [Schistosoma japonicum]|nr:translation initiation factor 4G [Schistosoma japonicum]